MTQGAEDVFEGLGEEQLSRAITHLETKRSNALIGELFPHRGQHRYVDEFSSEELCFEVLEGITDYNQLESPDLAWVGECAAKRRADSDDDPRLTDPIDRYLAGLLRGLVGPWHDKVRDPSLLIERYRRRFPDRVLQAAYRAASSVEEKTTYAGRMREPRIEGYSPVVREKLTQLAGAV